MAKLSFKYGAMNSGKSDTLIKTAYNYSERGLRPLVLKPAIDTKSDMVVARAGGSWPVDFQLFDTLDTTAIVEQEDPRPDVVLVDEAQFLSRDHIDGLFWVAKHMDISVVAFGLRTDFKGNMFPGAQALLSLADSIEKLPTMCTCGSQAEFNVRLENGKRVYEGDQVAIDGPEATYTSVCGRCWIGDVW